MSPYTRVKEKNQVDILRCNGDLSATAMVSFKNKVRKLMENNHKNVVLDMKRVKHVDLAGLGILVERIKQIRSVNGDIKLCNVQPQVDATFRLVGVSKLIESFSTEEEALRSFKVA